MAWNTVAISDAFDGFDTNRERVIDTATAVALSASIELRGEVEEAIDDCVVTCGQKHCDM